MPSLTNVFLTAGLLVVGVMPTLADAPVSTNAPLPATTDLRPEFTRWGLTTRLQGSPPTCSVFTVGGGSNSPLPSDKVTVRGSASSS